jgi:hypothetical protein
MDLIQMDILPRAFAGLPPSKTFKRTYKKSTGGCTSCKARKVKVRHFVFKQLAK